MFILYKYNTYIVYIVIIFLDYICLVYQVKFIKYFNNLNNMYISIVFLPFLAAIFSGLFGRALGVKGVYVINVTCLCITTFLSFLAFYEVVLCNSPVSVELFS